MHSIFLSFSALIKQILNLFRNHPNHPKFGGVTSYILLSSNIIKFIV